MKKNNNKGFTLVEVIAVVALMAIVLTFSFNVYTFIINNSKQKSTEISIDNIKSASELYAKENNDVTKWWGYYTANKQYKFYCITVQDLINNGYFGKNIINKQISSENNVNNNTLIKVVKDISNMTIIKTEISTETSLESCNKNLQNEIEETLTSEDSKYHITYDLNYDNNNKVPDIVNKTAANNYKLLNKPTRNGFIFNGWYSTRYGGTKIGDAGEKYTPTSDIVLYAHWTRNPKFKGVSIKYNVNGGTLASEHGSDISIDKSFVKINNTTIIHELVHGESLTKDGLLNANNKTYLNLTKEGYSIVEKKEWCTKPDGTGKCYNQAKVYNSLDFCTDTKTNCEIVLYTNWIKNYTITYNANGGSNAPTKQTKIHNQDITLSSNKPARTGYKFTGWNTKSNGSGTNYASGAKYTTNADLTLYAKWTANKYNVTYRGIGGIIRKDNDITTLQGSYSGILNRGFDFDSSAATWVDLSGYRNNGLKVEGTWNTDHLAFNGKDTYVDLGEINSGQKTIIVTFSTSSPSTGQNVIGNWEAAGGGIFLSGSKIYGQYYFNNIKYVTIDSNITLNANQIYTVALTYNGSKVRLYVDGVFKGEKDGNGAIVSTKTHMMMGCNPSGSTCKDGGYFSGNIYEAAILNTALDETRIKESSKLEITYDGKYTDLPNPTRNGFIFTGWNTQANGKGTKITSSTKVTTTSNQILYAQWEPIVPTGNYRILSAKEKGLAFDIDNALVANGTNVKLWTKGTTSITNIKAQTWEVTNIGDGTLEIINIHSQKALDLLSAKAEDGNNIQIYTDNNTLAQRWTPVGANAGNVSLISSVNRGFAIDITGNKQEKGTNIQIYTRNKTEAQNFCFEPISYNKKYKLVYDKNATDATGTMDPQTNIGWDQKVTIKENKFTRKGYKFSGWNSKKDGSGIEYEPDTAYASLSHDGSDAVLYAQWTSTAVKYYVTAKSGLNCRNKANGDKIIKTYACGKEVMVGDASQSWYYITNDSCYSFSKYLSKTKESCESTSSGGSSGGGSSGGTGGGSTGGGSTGSKCSWTGWESAGMTSCKVSMSGWSNSRMQMRYVECGSCTTSSHVAGYYFCRYKRRYVC